MKRTFGLSLLMCTIVAASAAIAVAGGAGRKAHAAIAEGLGVRWEQPVANARVGDKVQALIVAPDKLRRFGMTVKSNDRIVVNRTGENKLVVRDLTGRQQLTFTFDSNGVLTLAR